MLHDDELDHGRDAEVPVVAPRGEPVDRACNRERRKIPFERGEDLAGRRVRAEREQVAARGREVPQRYGVVDDAEQLASGIKPCPQCAEDVKGAAPVFRSCWRRFDTPTVQAPPPPIVAARSRTPPRETTSPRTSGAPVAAFTCSVLGFWIVSIPLGIHARREVDRSNS